MWKREGVRCGSGRNARHRTGDQRSLQGTAEVVEPGRSGNIAAPQRIHKSRYAPEIANNHLHTSLRRFRVSISDSNRFSATQLLLMLYRVKELFFVYHVFAGFLTSLHHAIRWFLHNASTTYRSRSFLQRTVHCENGSLEREGEKSGCAWECVMLGYRIQNTSIRYSCMCTCIRWYSVYYKYTNTSGYNVEGTFRREVPLPTLHLVNIG
jgi:hypothetical protein